MIELRGPTEADNYRVKTGRFGDRFYTDPLPADDKWEATGDDDVYPAVSTVKKATGQDWTKAAMKRLAKDPRQLIEIGNIPSEFERKERLNVMDESGLDGHSGRGTIVHQHAEALLANRLPIYQMTDVVKPYIRTLEAFFAAYNPVQVAVEFVAIHRDMNIENQLCQYHGYGGTGDAVVEIEGEWYLVDWKSRGADTDHKAYAEEGAQVSAYGRAQYWIVGDDNVHGAKRILPPPLAGGLIVSIKPDSYECYPIDLDKGFEYWTDLHAWWQARRSETASIGRKWAPRAAPKTLMELHAAGELTGEPVVAGPIRTSELVVPEPVTSADGRVLLTPDEVETPDGSIVVVDHADMPDPTRERNKERFEALGMVEKADARARFKQAGVDPRNPDHAVVRQVAHIIAQLEARPTLREMQEARKAVQTDSISPDERKILAMEAEAAALDAEGGPATDEVIAEARLRFDMVLGDRERQWTGFRVKEANEAGVSFRISELASARRASLYLILCNWAHWRGEDLVQDEVDGNIEFMALMNMVQHDEDVTDKPLGARLGLLTSEQAARFAELVNEVVESESGEEHVTEPETQPVNQPA